MMSILYIPVIRKQCQYTRAIFICSCCATVPRQKEHLAAYQEAPLGMQGVLCTQH
jgi:hypothetical protein